MWLYLISFFSWILTILAPCVLPLLPVIVWSSIQQGKKKRILTIVWAFMLSVIVFTWIIKASTVALWLSADFRKLFSGGLLLVLWVFMLFPQIRQKITVLLKLNKAKTLQQSAAQKTWSIKDILLWVSLWPVFTSCSPTYGLILSVVLPASLTQAMIHITLYALGLWLLLFVIGRGWSALVRKVKRAAKPDGRFAKIIAWLVILTWLAIIMWRDKKVETFIVEQWLFIDTIEFEEKLLEGVELPE